MINIHIRRHELAKFYEIWVVGSHDPVIPITIQKQLFISLSPLPKLILALFPFTIYLEVQISGVNS